ncbi:MAG: GBS Bsp-like repeat-containing protein [Lachnospiraceae bacterium]|nr:GBS Bsp-like repeat-containing protein [Lachnospiraceae bacterium]
MKKHSGRLLALLLVMAMLAGTFFIKPLETRAAGTSISLIYDGLNYACVFDPVYYAKTYPDVKRAYGNNQKAAFDHFLLCGMKEGRIGKASFNVFAYINRYKDLRDLYGCDLVAYYKHYMTYGWLQGRNTKPYSGKNNLRNKRINYVLIDRVYNGVDYAAVFNPIHYIDKYPDVKAAYGFDQKKAFDHFILCGMREGRQGKQNAATNYIKAIKTGDGRYKVSIINPRSTSGEVTDVYMPTWTTEDGADDINWLHAQKTSGDIWVTEVNGPAFNVSGEYNTAVYGVAGGSMVCLGKVTYINEFEVIKRHGWYQINGDYYYFDRTTGVMQKGGEACGISLNSDGSAQMNQYAREKVPMMVRSREIVEQITNSWDDIETKKEKCYKYVADMPYLLKDYPVGDHIHDWACLDAHYANNLLNGYGNQKACGGDCVAEAAALAYLYAELNFGEVYLYSSDIHGWVCAAGRHYDPLCREAEGAAKWWNLNQYYAQPTYVYKIN